jgi:rare lipoprotein A
LYNNKIFSNIFIYSSRINILFFIVGYLLFSNFVFVALSGNTITAPDSVAFKTSVFSQTGIASLYANKFHNRKTASGEKFNMYDYTAAHRSLEFGRHVKVTNLKNNKFVTVRINDRGPHVKGRIIDLSYAAAKELDFINHGTAQVKIETIFEPNPSTSSQNENNPLIAKNENKPLTREISPQNSNTNADKKTLYSVQVGAFVNSDNAEKFKKSLIDKNFQDVNILQTIDKNTVLYKVIVGKFLTYEEANSHKEKLLKNNIDCFIIRNN